MKNVKAQVAVIENAAKKAGGVTTEVTVPPIADHRHVLKISCNPAVVKLTKKEMQEKRRTGAPSIEVMSTDDTINVAVFMLKPMQEKVVANRVRNELTKAST